MKKLVILILVAFGWMDANAQMSFGVKGGMNLSTISKYENVDVPQSIVDAFTTNGSNSFKFGYNAGVFLNYSMGDGFFAFQPELLWSNQGMKYKGDVLGISGISIESTVQTNYINVPIMLQFYFIPHILCIEAGPQVGFLVSAKNYSTYSAFGYSTDIEWDLLEKMNTVDFSLAFGLGFKIPGLPIGVNARYALGFTEVNKQNENDGNTNSVFQAGVFLKFGYSEK